MPEYPGQELSLEQLFYAVNAKILEQTGVCQSSVPGPNQQRLVGTCVTDPWQYPDGLTLTTSFRFSRWTALPENCTGRPQMSTY